MKGVEMNYSPPGLYVWDTWYIHHDGLTHSFHLQKKRSGSKRPDEDDGAIGHAVSEDLVNWHEKPVALYKGETGSIDDLDLWTGCTTHHNGKFYMYYTARSSKEEGRIQRICLATSDDLMNWGRHPVQPVVTPDARWYWGESNPPPNGFVGCRDLIVVRDPESDWFYGFFAATQPAEEVTDSAVIALARSKDLVKWEQLPPAWGPRKYACVEVPDVFFMDGRWYMIALTGQWYGNRSLFTDPYITRGTVYAVSERIQGPYRELYDNVLVGSMRGNGFSCRTVEVRGKRYLFYTQAERVDRHDDDRATWGSITTPKELRTSRDGRLLACYSSLIEKYRKKMLFGNNQLPPTVQTQWIFDISGRWNASDGKVGGEARTGWSVLILDLVGESFIWSAMVRLERGRSLGLVFRGEGDRTVSGAYAIVLDFEEQAAIFTELRDFLILDARRVSLERGRSYHLKIVAKGEFIEAFLDGVLVLQLVRYRFDKGFFGLMVEQGKATFRELEAYELNVGGRAYGPFLQA
jgi:beta-fructofuranosidase